MYISLVFHFIRSSIDLDGAITAHATPDLKCCCCPNHFNPIWTGGGGQNAPLRVFAKYLKKGLANLYKTL